MQVMIWTELKKLRRSRMLLVALFGLCMVLVIVTAQGFFAGGNEAYGMEPEWYLTGVQSLGTMYALPGIIALFGSYIICRESQEDVLKSLLLIPVNMGKMVVAKVMVILVFSVGTYFMLFLAAFAVEMAFHAQVLTAAIFWHYLKIYLVDGICVFFAVLPIICFITEKSWITGSAFWQRKFTPLSRSLWETWEPYPNCIRWWLRSRFPGITNPPRRKSCSV